jgi:hypothetical protein
MTFTVLVQYKPNQKERKKENMKVLGLKNEYSKGSVTNYQVSSIRNLKIICRDAECQKRLICCNVKKLILEHCPVNLL